jgi:hypothetical protein
MSVSAAASSPTACACRIRRGGATNALLVLESGTGRLQQIDPTTACDT